MPRHLFFNLDKLSVSRLLLFLFAASLTVRLVFWFPVAICQVPPVYDEVRYLERAAAMADMAADYIQGRAPQEAVRQQAYGRGWWPPLHAMVLSLGLLGGGGAVLWARLIMVIISALTTPLVFAVTHRMSDRRPALWAAGIHLLYPSFIAYSHYLWSETTYIFLLLSAVYFILRLPESKTAARAVPFAAAAGTCLGLCALTRSAALPVLVFAPVWLLFSVKPARIKITALAILALTCTAVLLPWQTVLVRNEKHFVFMGTSSEMSLYYGNNPHIPPGRGQSAGAFLLEGLNEYAWQHSVTIEAAARALAVREIQKDFKQFLSRCFIKLNTLWTYDGFLLRHVLQAAYPPLPAAGVGLLWIVVFTSFVLLAALAALGLMTGGIRSSHKVLLILLALAGTAPPLVANAFSRLHLPVLAVLLPLAGSAAGCLVTKKRSGFKMLMVVGVILLLSVLSAARLPMIMRDLYAPSSCYQGLISAVDWISGGRTPCTDRITIRSTDPQAEDTLTITAGSNADPGSPRAKSYRWEASARNRAFGLRVLSRNSRPLTLHIDSRRLGKSVSIAPVDKSNWRQWQPLGLPGFEYLWPAF